MSGSMGESTSPPPLRAAVKKVVGKSGGKSYVVTFPTEGRGEITSQTSVTFTLNTWKGKRGVSPGQIVDLHNLELFSGGWRAHSATPIVEQ